MTPPSTSTPPPRPAKTTTPPRDTTRRSRRRTPGNRLNHPGPGTTAAAWTSAVRSVCIGTVQREFARAFAVRQIVNPRRLLLLEHVGDLLVMHVCRVWVAWALVADLLLAAASLWRPPTEDRRRTRRCR